MKKTKSSIHPATSSIRFHADDWALIEKLQKKTRLRSVTELIRMALGALAEKEGVE